MPLKHVLEPEQDAALAEVTQPAHVAPEPQPVTRSSEELNVVCERDRETEYCLECLNVPLKHGSNEYNLTVQVMLLL